MCVGDSGSGACGRTSAEVLVDKKHWVNLMAWLAEVEVKYDEG